MFTKVKPLGWVFVLGLLAVSGHSSAPVVDYRGTVISPYGGFQAEFELKNDSNTNILCDEYSSGLLPYELQAYDKTNWVDCHLGWCGSGTKPKKLTAGELVEFAVPIPNGIHKLRIGLPYVCDGEAAEGGGGIVWSSGIDCNNATISAKDIADTNLLVKWEFSRRPDRVGFYQFNFLNCSTNTYYFGGYSESNIPPIYMAQEWKSGRWHDDGTADWSGSNVGFKPFGPGTSIIFSIPAQSLDFDWRIGVTLYRCKVPRDNNDIFGKLWGPTLPPRGQAPADSQ